MSLLLNSKIASTFNLGKVNNIMAKIVQTQYRENYGAHDWDGTGVCPQHWKNKFGSTYVVIGEGSDFDSVVNYVINHKSDYSEEYIISSKDVSDEYVENVAKESSIDFEPWEDRNYLYINAGLSRHPIVEIRRSGFEGLRRGLASVSHQWEYESAKDRHAGNVAKYSVQYLFKNGMVANSEKEARKIFDHLDARAKAECSPKLMT